MENKKFIELFFPEIKLTKFQEKLIEEFKEGKVSVIRAPRSPNIKGYKIDKIIIDEAKWMK